MARKGTPKRKKSGFLGKRSLTERNLRSEGKKFTELVKTGNSFFDKGELDRAISCYKKAVALRPESIEAYYNMGCAFLDQGRLEDAIRCYGKTVSLNPHRAEPFNNMGIAFQNQGKSKKALSCFRKAVDLNPFFADAYFNLGTLLLERGKLSEAIRCFERAIHIRPGYAEAYYNMGNAFQEQNNIEQAIECYQRTLHINPDSKRANNELLQQMRMLCFWEDLDWQIDRTVRLTKKALNGSIKPVESPFYSLTRHGDLSDYLAIARSWSIETSQRAMNYKIRFSFDHRRSSKDKIKIGYISVDFRNSPVAHLISNLFCAHDRKAFKVFCYSYGKDDGSQYRSIIQQGCDKFVDLYNVDNPKAARQIYRDEVDILVDLTGHTGLSRLDILALRPAPVQVNYLGFLGTTGADFIDYIISDRIVTPETQAAYYSEKFVYLPHCYQVTNPTLEISEKGWEKADFGIPENCFVYCSFNSPYKIEPKMFGIWMKILRKTGDTVLWLTKENHTVENNLKSEAERRGVSPERLIFSENVPLEEHLARLKLADLGLDTRLYNGGATTTNALQVGVPVITLQGHHFTSRMSSSILTAVGLPELITHTLEDYENLAVRLAQNPDQLEAIRTKLDEKRSLSPLFDTLRFVKNLEKAYKKMWDIFLSGGEPRLIEVEEN